MTKGTQNKTAQELEEAIEELGASINVSAQKEYISISGVTLAKNYDKTISLLEEIILAPRWDQEEFDLAIQRIQSQIQQQEANPDAVADNAYNLLIYGKDNIRSRNILGTVETVSAISMEDLKEFYVKNFSPSVARMHVIGAVEEKKILTSLETLDNAWAAKEVKLPENIQPNVPLQSQVYFYDVPDAKQSVLRIGYPALAVTDEDYYPVTVMNYILGGGGFASQLTQELREGKGYTYGIRSGFSGSKAKGPFTIGSGVRSNVTLESTQLIKEILEKFGPDYSDADLETTKSFLLKSNARAFETAQAKLRMLQDISAYGWEHDYVKSQEAEVRDMTVDRIRDLSQNYLDANKMIWLVVGDAKTQLGRMSELGFGEPVLLNPKPNSEK